MMSRNYEYLKPYMRSNYGGVPVEIGNHNVFDALSLDDIKDAEIKMNMQFPYELKDFYQSIGYGHLTTPHRPPKGYDFYSPNEILPPHIAVDYMLGILQHPEDGYYYMSESAYEDLEAGDLPFFEIGDSCRYLIMKLNSDNPNAVWSVSGIKIEDSFERFIWRLYYESPWFYDDIIEDFYKERVA